MREISSSIDVKASPEAIWEILANVEGWSDWSSMINASSGQIGLGDTVTLTMIGKDGGDGPRYSPVVTEMTAPKNFRWRAKMGAGFIFTNDKTYVLEPTDTGTRVVHTEYFSGFMAALMWGKMKNGVGPIIDAMNADLKAKAESA